jgi:hypothetical protein
MKEFFNAHELTNLQSLIYCLQFFCLGAILGVLVVTPRKRNKKTKTPKPTKL